MNFSFLSEVTPKLLMAIFVGGLIGAEREYHDKAAGFRTLIFICVGSTLFTILSVKFGGGDPSRVAAQIVSGVGFLGAGAILRDGGKLVGLTTAATIWLAAALGMGIGVGEFAFVIEATVIILTVLLIFPRFQSLLDRARDSHTYQVMCGLASEAPINIEKLFAEQKMHVRGVSRHKTGDSITYSWSVVGPRKRHGIIIDQIFKMADVMEFRI